MSDKKIEAVEEEKLVSEKTAVIETEQDDVVAAEKEKSRTPFALGVMLAVGVVLAVSYSVYTNKSEGMAEQLTDVDTVEALSSAEIPVAATTVSEQSVVEAPAQAAAVVTAPAPVNVFAGNRSFVAPAPYTPMPRPQFAQVRKDMQQQSREAFQRDMQRQQQMMSDMFAARKAVFEQAEARRQASISRMQKMQAESEKRQMEMLKRSQQDFEKAMQRI